MERNKKKFKSVVFMVRQTPDLLYFPLLHLQNALLYYCRSALWMAGISLALRMSSSLVRSTFSARPTDKGLHFSINFPAESSSPACKNSRISSNN